MIMVLYLNHSLVKHRDENGRLDEQALLAAIREGAMLRMRPKVMTVATINGRPAAEIMWGGRRLLGSHAAPMVGGMVSAPLLSMLVIPALYKLLHRRG